MSASLFGRRVVGDRGRLVPWRRAAGRRPRGRHVRRGSSTTGWSHYSKTGVSPQGIRPLVLALYFQAVRELREGRCKKKQHKFQMPLGMLASLSMPLWDYAELERASSAPGRSDPREALLQAYLGLLSLWLTPHTTTKSLRLRTRH